ncbi:hypothetical protein AAFF_G00331040 [Aldrovandia affinis]|uniref:Uncharacterized protein n=1 Tax=Aldrovandia affinis TaxID=143900 RepID=A0AAD7VZE4_9TELE|nr:hypothetical protein AAFF_G00331040 [Aldrovandia affinis]
MPIYNDAILLLPPANVQRPGRPAPQHRRPSPPLNPSGDWRSGQGRAALVSDGIFWAAVGRVTSQADKAERVCVYAAAERLKCPLGNANGLCANTRGLPDSGG